MAELESKAVWFLIEGGILRLMLDAPEERKLAERVVDVLAGLKPTSLEYQLRRLPLTFDGYCSRLGLPGLQLLDRLLNAVSIISIVSMTALLFANRLVTLPGMLYGVLNLYLLFYVYFAKQAVLNRALASLDLEPSSSFCLSRNVSHETKFPELPTEASSVPRETDLVGDS